MLALSKDPGALVASEGCMLTVDALQEPGLRKLTDARVARCLAFEVPTSAASQLRQQYTRYKYMARM